MRKLFSLLLALMLVFSLALPAYAASGSITYKGKSWILVTPAAPAYTDSDMFGNFKNAMPGDVLEETVKITNLAADSDYVAVYFQAVPHGATNNPSKKVTEAGETLASMEDFLKQLHLEVKRGDKVIFSGSPDQGSDRIFLRDLNRFKSMELTVTLTVPKELGNEYAHREGEVDWVFTFNGMDYPEGQSAKTGDYIMVAVGIMAISAMALAAVFVIQKRKRR